VSTAGLFDPANSGTGTFVLTYAYGSGNCLSTDTMRVTVNPLPVVSAGLPKVYCIDAGTQQLVGTPAGGIWSGTGVNSTGVFNPATAGVGTYILTYTFTATTNCSNTSTVSITVNPLPVVNAGPNLSFCDTNLIVQISGATPFGGFWTGTNISNTGALNLGPLLPGLYSYYYTYLDGNGCDAVDSIEVTITTPTQVDAGNNNIVCVNDPSFNLIGTPSGGTWSGQGVTGNSFNPSIATVGIWTLTYTLGSGTCQTSDTRTVTVNALPVVSAGTNKSFCVDAGIQQLIGSPSGGVWSGTGVSASGAFNPVNAGVGTHFIMYSFTNSNNCTNTATVNISVNPLPVVDAGQNLSFCDTNLVVQISGATPIGGLWTGSNITGTGALNLGPLLPGVYTYYYTYTDGNSCDAVDSILVTISTPTPANAGNNNFICVNDPSFNLIGTPSGGTWSGQGVIGNTFSPALATVGVWTLTYTIGSGTCQTSDTRTVTVYALPVVSAGSAASYCIDAGLQQLNGTPSGGTWSGVGVSPSGQFNPITAGLGLHTLTYSFTNSNNCTNTNTVAITVNSLPIVDAGNTVTFCDTNLIVQLNGATPLGGVWSGNSISGSGSLNLGPLTPGQYSYLYTYTDINGCDAVDSTVVTITVPIPANAGTDTTVCVNAAIFPLIGTPTSGVWSGSGVVGNNFNSSLAGIGTWTLTYIYGVGTCQTSDTKTITVNALPNVSAGSPISFCIDASTQVLLGSPAGGIWSGNGVSSGGIFDPSLAGIGAHVLTYTYTAGTNCTNSDTVTITVHGLPIVDAGNNISYCDTNLVVQLAGFSPTSGVWSGSNISSSGAIDLGPLLPGQYTYVYSFTDNFGCSSSDSIIVTITTPVLANAGSDSSLCISHAPITLNGLPAGGIWSGIGVSGNLFDPSVALAGTWNITYTYGTGTCQTSDNVSIIVNPLPIVSAGTNKSFCIDAGVQQLFGTPPGGTWSGSAISTAGLFDPSNAGAGLFTVTYSFTDTNACVNSANAQVTVNDLPIVNAGNDTTYCYQPIIAQLPIANPLGGSWSGIGVVNSTLGIFDPSIAGVGVDTIVYTYSDINNCVNRDTILVTIANPATVIAGSDTSVCVYSSPFQLNGSPINGNWLGTIVSTNGIVNPNQSGNFNLIYSYGVGTCLRKDSIIIIVNPLPTINLSGNINSVCVDQQSVNLSANPIGGSWLSPNINSGIFNPSQAGTGSYYLVYTYTDINGCSNKDSTNIVVHPLPVVSAGNDTSVCDLPSPVNFYGNFNNQGLWSGIGVTQTGEFTSPGVGSYNLYYSYSDINNCTNTDTMVVTVVAPQIAEAGPGDTICIDNGILILPAFFPATGGHWSGPGIINSSTGLFDPILAFQNSSITKTFTLYYEYGSGNCYTIDSTFITINPLPVVIAGSDKDTCISIGAFNLNGNNPLGGWWLGNGITDTLLGTFNPIIAGVGQHLLIYNYINPYTTCKNADSLIFTVNPLPSPSFSIDSVLCLNVPFNIVNTSTGGTQWIWDFGNGTTSNLQSPIITYNSIGSYSILLLVISQEGCVDSIRKNIIVVEPPSSSFTSSIHEGCGPLTVQFTNTSISFNPSFIWNYGNGITDTSANPNPVVFIASLYNDTTYYISLTATNLCGSAIYYDSVLVHPSPTAYFGTNVNSGCSPLTITFSNNSYGLPTSFIWLFGDGQSDTNLLPSPHVYYAGVNDTTYIVSLIAINDCNTDTITDTITVHPNTVNAFFNTNPTIGCAPLNVEFTNYSTGANIFSWDFGDGNVSSQINTSHTYLLPGNYTIQLIITNGCSFDTIETNITVWPQPQLDFSISKDSICPYEIITLNNTSPSVLSSLIWYWGDGDSSLVISPQHYYQQGNNYTITLIGTGSQFGCIDTIEKPVIVMPQPLAAFDSLMVEGCQPLAVNFTNSSLGATGYLWQFGDGNFSNSINPQHLYLDSGEFVISEIAYSSYGCTDTLSGSVVIHPKPESNFVIEPDSSCVSPITIHLNNLSTDSTGSFWTFGNGGTSNFWSPDYTYINIGQYNIDLITTNAFGCRDTSNRIFNVYPTPFADFVTPDPNGCEDFEVSFLNSSLNGVYYYWSFGDGNSSNDFEPTNLYTNPGVYNVYMIVEGLGGCLDTAIMANYIHVDLSPQAAFNYYKSDNPTLYGAINFDNNSNGASSYSWDFGDGETSNLKDPIHRYDTYGDYEVVLVATNTLGCTDTAKQIIHVDYFKGLFVPNAFTPVSGPEAVRKFAPKGKGLKLYRLEIFDTWGILLWSTNKLEGGSPSEGWDGIYKGTLLQQDVYIWKVYAEFEDGEVWIGQKREGVYRTSGTVTLLR
jgi:PKD repeat protein